MFKNAPDDGEWKLVDHMIQSTLKSKRLQFRHWKGNNKKNRFLAVSCPICKYFMHTFWGKGEDDALVRLLWNSWFFFEPKGFSVNITELGNNKIPKDFRFHGTASNGGSIEEEEPSPDTSSTAATMGSAMPTESSLPDVDVASPPPPERECALYAPVLNLPAFEGPREEELPIPHFDDLSLRD